MNVKHQESTINLTLAAGIVPSDCEPYSDYYQQFVDGTDNRGFGMLAQTASVLKYAELNSVSITDMKRMLVRIVNGVLDGGSAVAEARVKQYMQLDHPRINSLDKSKMTVRYLMKHLGVNAIAMLAANACSARVIDQIMLSRMDFGDWTSVADLYGFDPNEVTAIIENRAHGNLFMSLAEACALWPQGPFPNNGDIENFLNSIPATNANTTQTTEGETTMTNTAAASTVTIKNVDANIKPVLNAVLTQAGVNLGIDEIVAEINGKAALNAEIATLNNTVQELQLKVASVRNQPAVNVEFKAGGAIPSGEMKMVDASSVFPQLSVVKNLMVPTFTWNGTHPDVPAVNANYVFRTEMLLKALRCLSTGEENGWLHGHTGSGKTTFIEQVAARLGWPVARIAFDSNVDRHEMIGRMSLESDGKGGTVSRWLPGIIERAMSGGYILLADEIDAGHPNALYVMQPILEGKPFTLLEDGGRVINRHPLFRIFATGNTTGNGDPSGLYPACRILSAATLDRFQTFINVPYMTLDEEVQMISAAVPGLKKQLVKQLAKFAGEMREAFVTLQTPISYSPRRSIAFAREVLDLQMMGFSDEAQIITSAFRSKLYDAASEEFKQRLTEIANACFGGIDPTKNLL